MSRSHFRVSSRVRPTRDSQIRSAADPHRIKGNPHWGMGRSLDCAPADQPTSIGPPSCSPEATQWGKLFGLFDIRSASNKGKPMVWVDGRKWRVHIQPRSLDPGVVDSMLLELISKLNYNRESKYISPTFLV